MKKSNSICMLSDLRVGQKAKIVSLKEKNKEIKRHLLDMGLTKGTEVSIKKIAPMGDPIDIKIREYELCIAKKNLENIEVEVTK